MPKPTTAAPNTLLEAEDTREKAVADMLQAAEMGHQQAQYELGEWNRQGQKCAAKLCHRTILAGACRRFRLPESRLQPGFDAGQRRRHAARRIGC